MERNELWEVIENMKEYLGPEQILDALCMSLDSDTLEEHLRYIDRNYETNCFED
jgi:ethanolamine utilization cobalamin adenosyltransferase